MASRKRRIRSLTKCGPLSERMYEGQPNRPKCSIRQLHAALAVASFVAYNSTHLENVSIMTSTYPLSGKGPMKSMLRVSIGRYVDVVNFSTLIGVLICDIF